MRSENNWISFLVCTILTSLIFLFSLWGAINAFRRATPEGVVTITRRGIKTDYPVHFFSCFSNNLVANFHLLCI